MYIGALQQGIFHDFDAIWFSEIGRMIVTSFLIIIIEPPLEFLAFFFLRYLLKAYDQCKCFWPKRMPNKTKKKTISGYKALYEGPHFDIEY